MASVEDIQTLGENLAKALDSDQSDVAITLLKQLSSLEVSHRAMNATKIHLLVNSHKKHTNTKVASICSALVSKWKQKKATQKDETKTKARSDAASPVKAGDKRSLEKSQVVEPLCKKPNSVSSSGDPKRDKCVAVLQKSLQGKWQEGDLDCAELAVCIEAAMHAYFKGVDERYLAQIRSLCFNLSNLKNRDFDRKVLRGEISVEKMPHLTPQDMSRTGVKVQTTTPGATPPIVPKKGDTCIVHYTGRLASTGAQFDSSRDKQPFRFRLGDGQVIKGWEEGIARMCVGEHATLAVASSHGYGPRGMGKAIPPDADLEFDVELLGVEPPQ